MSCPVWNNWFCRPETAFPPQATRACCLQRARDTVKLKAACAWVVAHRGHAQCDGRNQNCGRKSFEGAKIRPREELEENLQPILILGGVTSYSPPSSASDMRSLGQLTTHRHGQDGINNWMDMRSEM
jgi:hypothetical protein